MPACSGQPGQGRQDAGGVDAPAGPVPLRPDLPRSRPRLRRGADPCRPTHSGRRDQSLLVPRRAQVSVALVHPGGATRLPIVLDQQGGDRAPGQPLRQRCRDHRLHVLATLQSPLGLTHELVPRQPGVTLQPSLDRLDVEGSKSRPRRRRQRRWHPHSQPRLGRGRPGPPALCPSCTQGREGRPFAKDLLDPGGELRIAAGGRPGFAHGWESTDPAHARPPAAVDGSQQVRESGPTCSHQGRANPDLTSRRERGTS